MSTASPGCLGFNHPLCSRQLVLGFMDLIDQRQHLRPQCLHIFCMGGRHRLPINIQKQAVIPNRSNSIPILLGPLTQTALNEMSHNEHKQNQKWSENVYLAKILISFRKLKMLIVIQ